MTAEPANPYVPPAAPQVQPSPWRLVRWGLVIQVVALGLCDATWLVVGIQPEPTNPGPVLVGFIVALVANLLAFSGMILALFGPWTKEGRGFAQLAVWLASPVILLEVVCLGLMLSGVGFGPTDSAPVWLPLLAAVVNLLKVAACGSTVAAIQIETHAYFLARVVIGLGGALTVPCLALQAFVAIVGFPDHTANNLYLVMAATGCCALFFIQPGVEWVFGLGVVGCRVLNEGVRSDGDGNPWYLVLYLAIGFLTVVLHLLYAWLLTAVPLGVRPPETAPSGSVETDHPAL